MQKILLAISILFQFLIVQAQSIDVQHYTFYLDLEDGTDRIKGKAEITLQFKQPVTSFTLDLIQQKADGKGMKIENVDGDNLAQFQQQNDQVVINLKKTSTEGQVQKFTINYSGIPADGLIISQNKYGDRTFFADNWPNRAHNWIPCVDRPIDKASFEFIVTAPAHYQVISNGVKVEEKDLGNNHKQTHWKEDVALSSKVMVIGVARFAVKLFEESSRQLPVSAWVYPQDSVKGFYDYGVAPGIVKFFSEYVAPYPYNKLANVQSKTIFGGMENASCIFYAEESVTGDRKSEDLLAHEIAHQWFGDMASEKSFAHLWLSEGFATYMTDFYFEKKYGKGKSDERLQKERQQVIQFMNATNHSVVDSTTDLMSLLNANSYQKGAWALHMLRNEVGDTVFQKIIQTYYQQYKGGNAETRDFEAVAEKVSGRDFKWYFDQWLYQPGIPNIIVQWKSEQNNLIVTVEQTGNKPYMFPLEIGYKVNNNWQYNKLVVSKQKETFSIKINNDPQDLVLDPNTKLLFKGRIVNNQ
jgi:aminopeptidase N